MTARTPRRILVGLAPSEQAETALNAAIDLADATDAELRLVYGVDAPRDDEQAVVHARQALEVQLDAHMSGARLPPGFAETGLIVECTRHPAQLLLEQARHWDADLLVLGRHRPRGWLHFGNTMRGVLSDAPCPVWVQSGPVRPLRHILVPVDLSEESLAALGLACAWAKAHDAHVSALHCFAPPELFPRGDEVGPGPTYVLEGMARDARAQFEHAMAAHDFGGVEHALLFVEEEPVSRILAMQKDVDLVMMGTHGRTGLSAALLGNVADAVLRAGEVPVVALRHPERSWLLQTMGKGTLAV
jgi:nucleotide-binding universal stress UspA family protein